MLLIHRQRDGQNLAAAAIVLLVCAALCIAVLVVSDARWIRRGGIRPAPAERRALFAEKDFRVPRKYSDVDQPVFREPVPPGPLPPYSLDDVLRTVPHFHVTLAVLVYDPASNKFIAHYPNRMHWRSSCLKLVKGIEATSHALRLLFPERFDPEKNVDEFAVSISSADFPGIFWNECLHDQRTDCIQEELGPILQFGSTFQRPLFPSMIPMPMPQNDHIYCYDMWLTTRRICKHYLPRGPGNTVGFVFGENIGLDWDDLIPQVVWRGTDFSYLSQMRTNLRRPDFDADITAQLDPSVDNVDVKTAATDAMRDVIDELIPRWKGVVWTATAEREAEEANSAMDDKEETDPILPWCNMKFASAMYFGKKTPTSEIEFYQQFNEHGVPAVGESMSLTELARYKYHIDVGGGGGTTWSGTIEKLGLPGLLFHHVTPTKDYFHDILIPWVHYVPVREDLSDLKNKFLWAESHPKVAKKISDNASEFARSLGTPEGMDAMFRQFYEWPLRQVVEAYQPLEKGSDWKEVVEQMGLRPITQCGGYYHHDCERLTDDIQFKGVHDRPS